MRVLTRLDQPLTEGPGLADRTPRLCLDPVGDCDRFALAAVRTAPPRVQFPRSVMLEVCSNPESMEWLRAALAGGLIFVGAALVADYISSDWRKPVAAGPTCPIHKVSSDKCQGDHERDDPPTEGPPTD